MLTLQSCRFVVRFTAPADVAKDAILVADETLTSERPSFEIGQHTHSSCSYCFYHYHCSANESMVSLIIHFIAECVTGLQE